MPPSGQRGATKAAVVAAACVVLLALAPRALPRWSEVVRDGRTVARDPDACYHLRRAERIAGAFPDLALFDPYVNYPAGAWVIWPPLYDLTLAGAVSLFPGKGDLPGPGSPVALLPPALFAGAALAVFLLARRLWPGRLGLAVLAAAVPALVPANAPYSSLGQLDHHAAELLVTALFLLALGDAAASAREGRRPAAAALAPGAALAAALLVQLSLVVLVPFVFVPALFANRAARARALELAAIASLAALALVLPWGLAYHAAGVPFAHFRFGLFQPGLLALSFLLAAGARALAAPLGARWTRPVVAIAAGLGTAGLAALLAGEGVRGITYVTGTFAPWQSTISESRHLLSGGLGAGLREIAWTLSALGFLVPVAAALLARDALRGDPRRAVLLAALVLFGTMGALQARFLAHLSLFVGIAAATVAERLLPAPRAASRSRLPSLVPAGAAVLAVLLALLPARRLWGARDEAEIAFERARPLLDYLAREAPPADEGAAAPARAGVLAEWSYGHFIEYHGRHPTLVDNFGNHVGDPTKIRAFFLATDEERALAFADSHQVRYVLASDLPSMFGGLIPDEAIIRRYLAQARLVEPGQGTMRFNEAIAPTVLYRLTSRNGSVVVMDGQTIAPALAHLALVVESAESVPGDPGVPLLKLYEVVPGARVRVEGMAPRAEGLLLATIRTPRGRVFPYVARLVAGDDGVAETAFPYATSSAAGRPAAVRCEIDLGGETVPIAGITEEMVRAGETVTTRATSAAPSPPPARTPASPRAAR